MIKAGATVINVPDTTGYSCPEEWGAFIRGIMEHVPNMGKATLSVHCHNDLGMATANALAGVLNGAQQVECTINGIGERAGNTSLEEVVMAIATRADLFDVKTGIRTQELYRTSRLVSDLTGIPVQPNKAIVGANAFAHSSGIHQDGFLKERTTYEIIDPKKVGILESHIALSARSGRHGLQHRLGKLGYHFSKEEFELVYHRFLTVADKKKLVQDEDLESIIADELHTVPEVYHLDYLHVVSGGTTIPTATVRLTRNGDAMIGTGRGVGSVDAVYCTIDQMLNVPHKLLQYRVESVTGGTEALGEVVVRMESPQGNIYSGRGSSTDIIEASAKAYLQAMNKLIAESGTVPARKKAATTKRKVG